jgi:hypothetical protein
MQPHSDNPNDEDEDFTWYNCNWIIEPSPTQEYGLALGNMKFASDPDELKKYKIGAVLSVMGEAALKLDGEIKHLRILIADNPE